MIWGLTAAVAVLAVYSVYAAFKYTRMISTIFMGLVYKASPDVPVSSQGESVTILDSSDREIQALHVRGVSGRIIIFCHESGSSKESWEKYASFLTEAGDDLISVDFPEKGNELAGNSLSQWPDAQEVDDLVTVIRWARRAVRPDARIVLFGVSKGADLALAASFLETSVSGVITDGLFSMKEIFRDYIRRWAPILVKPNLFGERYPHWVVALFANLGYWHCQLRSRRKFVDVEALLKRRHVPLLMIHGGEDDYVSSSHQHFLGRLGAARSCRHVIVPQARHNEAVLTDRIQYEEEIRSFLSRGLDA